MAVLDERQPNLADALRGLLDRGWELSLRRDSDGEYTLWSVRRAGGLGVVLGNGMTEGPDPAQLVLDLWAEVSGGKEGT